MEKKIIVATAAARKKILKSFSNKKVWQCKCGPCADSCTSGDRCG